MVDKSARAAGSAVREMKTLLPSLWMQAITEAGEDPEIRRPPARAHARGAFIGGSLLVAIADRLGGPLTAEDSPPSRPSGSALA